MTILLSVAAFIGMAVFMEFVAWAMHKYVMHGFLWVLHEDHHHVSGRGFQKNDLFFFFFAGISIVLIYFGVFYGIPPLAAAGVGSTLYGLGYFLFHDIMFHRRVRAIRLRPSGPYLQRIVRAHHVHHRESGKKEGGTSFGFLYAPSKYDKE